MNCPEAAPDRRVDAFHSGRFYLHQPSRGGFRAGLDAMLLAACVPISAAGRAVDLGAGTGAVGFGAVARAPALGVTLAENEPGTVALLARSLADPSNVQLASRLTLASADILAPRAVREEHGLADGAFDLVLTNPPFFPDVYRRSPDAVRHAALTAAGPDFLLRWLRAAAALVAKRGQLVAIARPDDLPRIAEAFERRLGALAVLPVHTREGPARRILIAARAGSREGLSILPGLDLTTPGGETLRAISDGAYTVELLRPGR